MSEHRGIWRAKRKDNGEWVTGYYVRLNGKAHRIYSGFAEIDCGGYYPSCYTIDPSTLGECSYIPDKNDTIIFEGDIVEYDNRICEIKYIEWLAMFDMEPVGGKRYEEPTLSKIISPDMLVIGNIHDNPELLRATGEDIGNAANETMLPAT